MKASSRVATGGLVAAAAMVLLYIAALMPAGRLGFSAAAGILLFFAVARGGVGLGTAIWTAVSALSLLLLPSEAALLFALFFGHYPVVKALAERQKSRVAEWAVKLLAFNLSAALILFAFNVTGFLPDFFTDKLWLALLAANPVFVVYDIGFTRVITLFSSRIKL